MFIPEAMFRRSVPRTYDEAEPLLTAAGEALSMISVLEPVMRLPPERVSDPETVVSSLNVTPLLLLIVRSAGVFCARPVPVTCGVVQL